MKANQTKEFVLPAVAEGANLDVASANELFLVKRMIEQDKFNAKIRVICNGPKTEKYIALIEELKAKGLLFNDAPADAFRDKLRSAGFYADWHKKFGDEAWGQLEKYTGKLS